MGMTKSIPPRLRKPTEHAGRLPQGRTPAGAPEHKATQLKAFRLCEASANALETLSEKYGINRSWVVRKLLLDAMQPKK